MEDKVMIFTIATILVLVVLLAISIPLILRQNKRIANMKDNTETKDLKENQIKVRR